MNLANKLTLSRIFLVPLFMVILLNRVHYGEYIAAFIFILAASTDGLDGYVARSRKQVTKFGKFIDPLADKLLISAALICLVEFKGQLHVPAWIAFTIIARELAVTGLRSIAASEGVVVSASKLGKVKTVMQIIAIVAKLIKDFPFSYFNIHYIGDTLLYIAVIITVWSGIDYYLKIKKLIRMNM